ncbi:class I SAM-dependent methyltransferase [Rossellomorea aquimaris]|uniref:class I SAM-dependent methyltransferase n=1 Tax=Rossellomorea aquimaris TaxID=189382 RepID=UPI0007D0B71C|nr:class I SAM-dependent methyltransferase [Rossellomorea aquimaris]
MKQNIYDNPNFFNEYMKLRNTGQTYNDFIEQPAMISLLPKLKGMRVLDLGCGTGQFSRFCLENGAAHVLGVDISMKMIEKANSETHHPCIDYQCMSMEDMVLPYNSFDLIVSSLAIHYIENYESLIKKLARLLKQNGELIISTEHPVVTARKGMNNWVKDEEGTKLHWAVDHYHEEGKREQFWYVEGVIKYHRTLSTLINTLVENGLTLQKIIEPEPTQDGLREMPKLRNEHRRPSFILLKSKKCNKGKDL